MELGYELNAKVKIGNIDLDDCWVIPALDTTLTVKFNKEKINISEFDSILQNEPAVIITEDNGEVTTYENRQLQAYRIDGNGAAEVSFLALPEKIEEMAE